MKKPIATILAFSSILVLPFFAISQVEHQQKKTTADNVEYIREYLQTFNNYINNPDEYKNEHKNITKFFVKSQSKSFYNFFSTKNLNKGYISPDSLVKHIIAYYPDGFGMVYNSDKIEFVSKKKDFSHKVYVYKIPVEYSGIKKDGSVMRYAGDQFIYVKTNKNQHTIKGITNISDSKYFKSSFRKKIYRQGLFIEPFFPVSTSSKLNLNISSGTNANYQGRNIVTPFGKNIGLNIIYMFKPFFGLGLGYSTYNYGTGMDIEITDYRMSEIFGYIPVINSDNLTHEINIRSITIPAFLRLQVGYSAISTSFDIGLGYLNNPLYDSYLIGNATFYGISIIDEQLVTNNPTYGFNNYTFENDLVYQYKSQTSYFYTFWRANLNLQFSKYFYLRVAYSSHNLPEMEYVHSWHMFDMFALRLPNVDGKWPLKHNSIELGIGFNINEMFLK